MPRGRTLTFRALASLIGLGLALGLSEGLLRMVPVEDRLIDKLAHAVDDSDEEGLFRISPDPTLVYGLTPGWRGEGSKLGEHGDDPRVSSINALGMRGVARDPAKPAGVFRIAVFGGSNTYGAAVSDDGAWPAQLERALHARGEGYVEVWNYGVSAYQTVQKVRQARWALAEHAPDMLVFQTYNRSPRAALLTEDLSVGAQWRRDPSLFQENARFFSHRPLDSIWFRSRLARLVGLFVEVWGRIGKDLEKPWWEMGAYHEQLGDETLAAFVREFGDRVRIIHVTTPAKDGPELFLAPLREIDLSSRTDLPALPDIREIHPGREVYAWYAETIADELMAAGCLRGPVADCGLLLE